VLVWESGSEGLGGGREGPHRVAPVWRSTAPVAVVGTAPLAASAFITTVPFPLGAPHKNVYKSIDPLW